jgi:pyridoxal phosphate enzyme (YggS family)
MTDIKTNVHRVMVTIERTARQSGRDPGGIKLLAATKTRSVAEVRVAIEAGVRLFGENYVQEGQAKSKQLDASVEWHMIGHLQRNKVKGALDVFSVVESLDSLELARVLDREAAKRGGVARAFVEVNLGGETTKSGVSRNQVTPLIEAVGGLPHLSIEGLMTVPPFFSDAEGARPYFRALKELQLSLGNLGIPNVRLSELSMGMTNDYAVAIQEGATIVRIGTAIFGERRT